MKKKLFKLQSELIKLQATAIDKIHGDIVEHKYGSERMDRAMGELDHTLSKLREDIDAKKTEIAVLKKEVKEAKQDAKPKPTQEKKVLYKKNRKFRI